MAPRTLLSLIVAIGVASCTTVTARAQPAPPRDRQPVEPTGTARLKGRVVDAQTGSAIVRARVRLLGPFGNRPPALTDASGAFEFTNLPAAVFYLSADKAGYANTRHPQQGRTIRGGNRPLRLADRETLTDITVKLYRGAAITGRVVDAYGDPAEFAQVQVLAVPRSGRGTPMPRGSNSTNDLGEFRVPKLEPGSYLLLVLQRFQFDDSSDMQSLPTYYPGVASLDQAQPITVTRAQTVQGIEITLVDATASIVTGTIVDQKGQPATGSGISVRRVSSEVRDFGGFGGPIRPDGTFKLRLAPGEYELEARGTRPGVQGMGPPRPGDELMGVLGVSVSSAPLSDLTIQLAPGAVMSGRIVLDGDGSPPPDVQSLRIALGSLSPAGNCRTGRSEVSADWTFRIEGMVGTCTVMPMGGAGRWNMKSVLREDVNLLDQPIKFVPGQVWRNVQVVLSDRTTQLTLDVTDDHGLPTREYVAVVFARDRARWTENSRYVRLMVPPSAPPVASTGATGAPVVAAPRPERPDVVAGLPPGEYYVAVVEDLPSEGSRDPSLLESLVADATRVTLTDAAPVRVAVRRRPMPQ